MQRLIDKNIHQIENNRLICVSENKECLCLICNGRYFFNIDLENKIYKDELRTDTGLVKHCDNIICSTELQDITIWIEFKSQARHNKIKDAYEQIEKTFEKFGQSIDKNYAVIVFNDIIHSSNRISQTVLQTILKQWNSKINEKGALFIQERTLRLEYKPQEEIISTFNI